MAILLDSAKSVQSSFAAFVDHLESLGGDDEPTPADRAWWSEVSNVEPDDDEWLEAVLSAWEPRQYPDDFDNCPGRIG